MWDLVTLPGTEPGPPALGAGRLRHWTTREAYLSKLLLFTPPNAKGNVCSVRPNSVTEELISIPKHSNLIT